MTIDSTTIAFLSLEAIDTNLDKHCAAKKRMDISLMFDEAVRKNHFSPCVICVRN